MSPDSSSPTRRLSPPTKPSRWDKRNVSRETSSSEGRQRSPRPRRPWRSRSPLPHRRGSSPSPSPHCRFRDSPAPSRCPYGASMTRRPAGHPCRYTGDHLLIGGHDDHTRAVSHPLRPEPGPLIVVHPYRPPGHLHPKDIGPVVCLCAVSIPGPPTRSVSLNCMHQTYASYASAWTMMTSVQTTSIHVIPLHQNNQHLWMTLSCQLRKCRKCSKQSVSSLCSDIFFYYSDCE